MEISDEKIKQIYDNWYEYHHNLLEFVTLYELPDIEIAFNEGFRTALEFILIGENKCDYQI